MCIRTYTLGGLGACSPRRFRLSETASGAFSGTVSLVFIKRFWEKLFSTDVVETGIERLSVAISKGAGGGGGDLIKGENSPPPTPLSEPQ